MKILSHGTPICQANQVVILSPTPKSNSAKTYTPWKDPPETLEKKRLARTGKKHTQEAKDKISIKHKGKTRSPEEIEKWRISYREYLDENGSPMTGKDRGQAFKDKMSEIAKNRPQEMIDAKVAMMLAARRGSKATSEQHERYSEARLKYISDHPEKMLPRLFNTKPEREFKQVLEQFGISYQHNVRIVNRLFDFKIGDDILIELDWPFRYNFKMYGDKSMPDEDRMALFLEGKKRDQYKNELAVSEGYTLYRITVDEDLPNDRKEQLESQYCDIFKEKPEA